MANEVSSNGHPDMDYAEHEKTYELFVALFKWGTVASIVCIVILGFLTL
ncbi:MAG: aa3-type cytochrome c oxidase subunit IV [Rhodoblastus sp.]